jgi:hydrogenase nickel incorporation protein HypA/HybF
MHELPVTQSILDIAVNQAKAVNAARITDVHLVIGQLASIVDDSVQFYWDIIGKGTIAEGAKLHFRRVPVELECRLCGNRYTPAREDLACPRCEGIAVNVVAGEEFRLESLEIEESDEDPAWASETQATSGAGG